MTKKYKTLSIIVPVYNEERTLSKVLDEIINVNLGIKKEIIVIDDCSKDKSRMIIEKLAKLGKIKALFNEKNMGKSQTVKKGVLKSTGDLVVVHDADNEYETMDLKEFVNCFEKFDVDFIYGNRFGRKNKTIYPVLWLGNSLLSFISSLFTFIRAGIWIRDMEVCFKMIKGQIFRDIANKIRSKSSFGLEPEITARLAGYKINGKHLKFLQIPITYKPRSFKEGKHIKPIKDGAKAIWEIVKFNLWGWLILQLRSFTKFYNLLRKAFLHSRNQ